MASDQWEDLMPTSSILDLAPITRHLRAMYRSRLLIAAVCHLRVFEQFGDGPQSLIELQNRLDLKDRPANVLFPALCAMGLLQVDASGKISLTDQGRYLTSALHPNLIDYVGLEGQDPGGLEMARRLKQDGPVSTAEDLAYVMDGENPSLMDDPETSRYLTLALAGRARHLSPLVARALPQFTGQLLDVAGGTGMFAYEWLLINQDSTATVFDRPQVLTVAAEFLDEFCRGGRDGASGVRQRVRFQPGNMLEDELPRADIILAASLFHDWPVETCELLAQRFADVLSPKGELWIHDVFLNDEMDGPISVTDYSAQLFWFTKGRAYSRNEYRTWLSKAGLIPIRRTLPTLMDYELLSARKL
jgi:O-methyltransferase domain